MPALRCAVPASRQVALDRLRSSRSRRGRRLTRKNGDLSVRHRGSGPWVVRGGLPRATRIGANLLAMENPVHRIEPQLGSIGRYLDPLPLDKTHRAKRTREDRPLHSAWQSWQQHAHSTLPHCHPARCRRQGPKVGWRRQRGSTGASDDGTLQKERRRGPMAETAERGRQSKGSCFGRGGHGVHHHSGRARSGLHALAPARRCSTSMSATFRIRAFKAARKNEEAKTCSATIVPTTSATAIS